MTPLKIFVVEDDPWYRKIMLHFLSLNDEYEVSAYSTANELLTNMYLNPDLVCIDFHLPDMSGNELLKKILSKNPHLPVIVVSSQDDINVAVELLKMGARDYIVKDEHTREHLWKSILHVRETLSLRKEVENLKDQLEEKFNFSSVIIGRSEAIKRTFTLLNKAIKSTINVSLSGETGTGKEVYARAIHFNSSRSRKPFVALNMSAIPRELIESELFGHEKGAFTGADSVKKGKFEEANGGTLFLDEIADLELSMQSKLLRAIQEREIVRLGGIKEIRLDIRLITATHKNLADEVKHGRFREDLYFRIMGLPIALPPLRERDKDVVVLAKHFIDAFVAAEKGKKLKLSDAARDKLLSYHWPGNVRELKAVIELACVMADEDVIEPTDISFFETHDLQLNEQNEKTMKEYEAEIIGAYLKKYNDNVKLVAEKLGLGKSKIYSMLKNGEIKE
jgi:DNA-binding NtrC family response regulator